MEGLEKAIKELVITIEAEPLEIGEPAESVQIGRLQVCDEIRHMLRLVRKKEEDNGQN